jgi:hypothetical protein
MSEIHDDCVENDMQQRVDEDSLLEAAMSPRRGGG